MANVSELWTKITEMEAEQRFEGCAYPKGMCAFPFKLKGQGFFPGGDGLWREDSALKSGSPGELPTGGVVFVGNDFGTSSTYAGLERLSYENPLTWQNLKVRIRDARIPTDRTFFTNAVLGLRTEGEALTPKDWEAMPAFANFCREFLAYQLDKLKPRLTVVMGPNAQMSFDVLGRNHSSDKVLYTTHPYADRRWPDTRGRAIEQLRTAWHS